MMPVNGDPLPSTPMPFDALARAEVLAPVRTERVATPRVGTRPVWWFIDLARDFGGHEMMVMRWIEALQRQGDVDPVLVCAAGSRLAERAAGQVRMVEVRIGEGSRLNKVAGLARVLLRLHALKREQRPAAVVAAEGCLMAQRHGLFAARALGLPTVLYVPMVSSFTVMGLPGSDRLDQRVRSFYRRLPTAWLTITPEQGHELRDWSGARQPMFSLSNTVPAGFDRSRAQARGPASARVRVLVLGRLEPFQKGLDRLLEHVKAHPELADRIELSIIGEGPYLPTLQAALRDDPVLARWVRLQGWADSATALSGHDVLMIPSRFEGVPLVMLEAMAVGVPVIATDMAGTRPYLPPSCLFGFGDLSGAFAAVLALQDETAWREVVVEQNLQSFGAQASPAAFDMEVRRLTAQFNALT